MSENTLWQIEDIKFVLNKFSSLVQWNGYQDERVLHYGINSGFILTKFLLPHLPRNVEEMVCVDGDDAKVENASRLYTHDKVQYTKIDSSDWKLGKFQHILSFYGIDELLQQKNLFKSLYKHLSANGDLFLISLHHHGFEYLHEQGGYSHVNTENIRICEQIIEESHKSLKSMLKEIGFGDIYCKHFERYQVFPNVAILRKSLKTYMAERKLPKDIIEENIFNLLANQTEIGAVKYMGRNRKVIAVPYTMTFVYAKKIVKLTSK